MKFHILHNWTIWKDSSVRYKDEFGIYHIVQERRCIKCNKARYRHVELY